MTGPRPVVYDLTYVAARLRAPAPTGIERVDAAFARHFATRAAGADGRAAAALHYGLLRPHGLTAATAGRLLAAADRAWAAAEGLAADPVYRRLAAWLGDPAPAGPALRASPTPPAGTGRLARLAARTPWRLADDRAVVPPRAIYLNVAQYAFEYPFFFRWLERRPDVTAAFFIHDLLPLDGPEFFREGYQALFERRVRTMARFAGAAIVSNDTVAARVGEEMRRRGRAAFPVFSAPLPPPTRSGSAPDRPFGTEAGGPAPPYFVAIGTIEPRKNHLLLLHLWRSLAEAGGPVPRLVLVGARGWENEQVLDLLDRSPLLAPHVAEVSGLSTPGLRHLIAQARAVLLPSFAEGYGLPLAEALAEGTPTVASDIPVFRDVSQGQALLLDALDGRAWLAAVRALCAPASPLRDDLRARAFRYVAPRWPDYFAEMDRFLASL